MDHIRQAVELAKTSRGARQSGKTPADPAVVPLPDASVAVLNPVYLEKHRVVAHDITDPRSKPYDILRTQVLRTMQIRDWRLVAITSPTPGCGKTLTAVNLAMSMARQPDRSVLLIDMDLQRPQVANTLGLSCEQGILAVLERRAAYSDVIRKAKVGQNQLMVLPCEASTSHSSEWMASREVDDLLQDVRKMHGSPIVILDLPPILPSDDVISLLPHIDCVLLVATVGISTASDIEQSKSLLRQSEVVKVVLNKSAQMSATTHYYGQG